MTSTLAALDGDCTLLTVNNRLALELRSRYDRMQAAAGKTVWPSADILPWSAWLKRQYERLLDHGVIAQDLLNGTQERLLWEAIIRRHPSTTELLQPAAAAQAARDAFALTIDWQLDPAQLDITGSDDTRTFLAWRETFLRRLERDGLITEAELPALVRKAIGDDQIALPDILLHSGFDSLSPGQKHLLDSIENTGCDVDEFRGERRETQRVRLVASDAEEEIRLAAHWAGDRLRENPACRIGIVSPRIRQQRKDLQRIFTEVLTPNTYLGKNNALPFDISLGEPLSSYPLVADALTGLRLLLGALTLAEAGRLLRSPFLGGYTTEWEGRALFDAALRDDGLPQIDLQRLLRRLERFTEDDRRRCPDLLTRLQALKTLRNRLPSSAKPSEWAKALQPALQTLGWPGDQSLDSHEYQQHQRLQQVFSEFTQLVKVRSRLRLGEALGQLATLAGEAVFQPKSAATPIRILGGLEATGMDFDHLWLLGLDDQAWPPAARPNPLLPNKLQRELGMPHASAERELAFAGALTERLAGSAKHVIGSHAHQSGEREQRPSPLIASWPLRDPTEIIHTDDLLRTACRHVDYWEEMPTHELPPDDSDLAGGTSLLAAQASCPFSAVARFRLRARPLGEPSFAPDAALNGALIHALLQRTWQHLRNARTLARHDNDALETMIRPLAEATLADIGRRRPDLYTPRFKAIETTRLTRLLIAWLTHERERTQDFEVIALEQDQPIEIGGLRLKTRADRVDRLADGSLAVIDYKTGRSIRDDGWFDDRLSEPQLPLYSLHEPGEVAATLLARVRRDGPGCGFVGLSRETDFAPGVKTPQERDEAIDWPTLLEHWRSSIAALADEIRAGRADPTPSSQACAYCPLGALCRVQEMLSEDDDG